MTTAFRTALRLANDEADAIYDTTSEVLSSSEVLAIAQDIACEAADYLAALPNLSRHALGVNLAEGVR